MIIIQMMSVQSKFLLQINYHVDISFRKASYQGQKHQSRQNIIGVIITFQFQKF